MYFNPKGNMMSLAKKVIALVVLLILFIVYSVSSFDYSTSGVEKNNFIISKEKPIVTKTINIEFEIVKTNNIVVISGLFRDESQVEILTNYLNINKTDHKRYDKNVIYKQKNIDEIKKLISPLKDYFEDGSKIVLKDSTISIDGTLNNNKLQPLLEAILNRSSVNINTNLIEKEVVLEEIEEAQIEVQTESIQDEINKLLKDKKIRFRTNSTIVLDESFEVIEKIAELIKNSSKDIFIEVAGHTDARGKKSTNKWISKQRAKSVMKKLIEFDVSKDMLEAKGYGETKPLVVNNSEGYSRLNRRVEIIVYDLENIEEDRIQLQEEIDILLKQQKINFERRSVKLTEESIDVIKEISILIKENEYLKVEIAGHTDAKGDEALNKRISLRRAKSVMDELIKSDVNRLKLTAVGHGEEQPIAQNDENGLSEINRRVEFIVKGVK
jgi:outer membrane protein OmpA-like peptidoglycan-associated protein